MYAAYIKEEYLSIRALHRSPGQMVHTNTKVRIGPAYTSFSFGHAYLSHSKSASFRQYKTLRGGTCHEVGIGPPVFNAGARYALDKSLSVRRTLPSVSDAAIKIEVVRHRFGDFKHTRIGPVYIVLTLRRHNSHFRKSESVRSYLTLGCDTHRTSRHRSSVIECSDVALI